MGITRVRVTHTNGLERHYKGIKTELSGQALYIECMSEPEEHTPQAAQEIRLHTGPTYVMLGDGQVIDVTVHVSVEDGVLTLGCSPAPVQPPEPKGFGGPWGWCS